MYLTRVKEQFDSPKELLKFFQKNLCRLDEKTESELQKTIKEDITKVDDHNKYFKFLDLKTRTPTEINEMLK